MMPSAWLFLIPAHRSVQHTISKYVSFVANFSSLIWGITLQITGSQKLHSEVRAAQLLAVRVHFPCYVIASNHSYNAI